MNKKHPAVRCCSEHHSAWAFNAGPAAEAVMEPWVMAVALRKQLMQRIGPAGLPGACGLD